MSVKVNRDNEVIATASPGIMLVALAHGVIAAVLLHVALDWLLDRVGLQPPWALWFLLAAFAFAVISRFRVRVVANAEQLRVTNLYRTVHIRWTDIESVERGFSGRITVTPCIRTRDGRTIKVVALAGMPDWSPLRRWAAEVRRQLPDTSVHDLLDQFETSTAPADH